MKRFVLLAILLFISVEVEAQDYDYIGLFTDAEQSSSCVSDGQYSIASIYICVLPRQQGHRAAEFAIKYPDNVSLLSSSTTYNESILNTHFAVDDWFSFTLKECMNSDDGWYWFAKIEIMTLDSNPSWIEVTPIDPSYPNIFYECNNASATPHLGIVYSAFGINRECPPDNPIGTELSSWGKIKSIYNR